jgi:integrase
VHGGHCPGPLLVLTPDRGPILDCWNFPKVFSTAVTRAKLGHVRIHDLRCTYASRLLQHGRSQAEVGDLLGHTSPLTMQRYARLAEVASEEVLGAPSPDPAITPKTPSKPVDELAARRAQKESPSA